MAKYNFEGNFTNISDRQLQFVNEVVLQQNLQVKKVVFHSVGQVGDNFMSNVKRINIEGENGSMKMILKIAHVNEKTRKSTFAEAMFNNEHVMYTDVLPKFVALQKAAGVPEEDHLRFAKCYGSLDEAPHEVIILEDLKESGYTMLDKFEPLRNDTVKSILKTFATFHSLSHVLKNKEPETYELYVNKLIDFANLITDPEEYIRGFKSLDAAVESIIENESHKKFLKNRISNTFELYFKLLKEEDTKYSVFQHGDSWVNNMLFKLVEGEVASSVLVDYQVSKRDNPMVDILRMIFSCTDHESRTKNFYNWLDYYHSEFDKTLSYFGLRADVIYPRTQLDADLKKYCEVMLGMALMTITIADRDKSEAGEILNSLENGGMADMMASVHSTTMSDEILKHVRSKIEGLIASYHEFGLVDYFEYKY